MKQTNNVASAVEQILKGMEATADASYARFCGVRTKCTTRPETVLGIRMGVLRRAMKELVKAGMDDALAREVLLPKAREVYEYKILYGGVMQKVCPQEKVVGVVQVLLSLCDGWATCDFFAEPIAHYAKHGCAEWILEMMAEATKDSRPFARRLSVVSMIRLHKLGLMTPAEVIDRCAMMQGDEEYYVQMAIAWVLAELYVHDSPSVALFMQEELRSDDIRRMLVRKLKDSYRVEDY